MSELIIKDWQNGIADSRVGGFADMRCVDIYSEPGLLMPGMIGNKQSSTTITGLPTAICYKDGASTAIYVYDDVNKLYTATDPAASWSNVTGNTQTGGVGNGMIVWKGYAITARNTAVDVYNIGTPGWTNGWGGLTLTSDAFHPMIVGQDDIVYIANERYVASIQENAGQTFDPTNAATYTATAQALDLPAGYRVKCLAELGQYLMIGTWQGSNIYDKKIADIFPWDRTSSSFDIPIRLNEFGIHQMINKDNTLYVVTGEHNFYTSNGTSASEFRKIPRSIWNKDGGLFTNIYPGAICAHKNRILSGTAVGTSGGVSPMGVFSVTADGRLLFEAQPSTGSANTVTIGALLDAGADTYLIGWKNTTGSAYGIDLVGNNGRHSTAANAYANSQMYAVGSKKHPEKYDNLEIQLAEPLATGQSVVVGYRTDTSASFTTLKTFSYASYGAAQSLCEDIGLTDIENIQIQVQVASNATAYTCPKVYYVKLY